MWERVEREEQGVGQEVEGKTLDLDDADISGIEDGESRVRNAQEKLEQLRDTLAADSAAKPPRPPVSAEHRDMLRTVATKLLSSVKIGHTAFYGGPGDEPKAQSFKEHFPEIAKKIASRNGRIDLLGRERRELEAWTLARLKALGYGEPPFAGGFERMIAAQVESDEPGLEFTVPGIAPPCLHLGPYVIVQLPAPPGHDQDRIERELREVLDEAIKQPQRQTIRQLRSSLDEASAPLENDLELLIAKDVISGLGDCVLCR
jgi:hypothetical protein